MKLPGRICEGEYVRCDKMAMSLDANDSNNINDNNQHDEKDNDSIIFYHY